MQPRTCPDCRAPITSTNQVHPLIANGDQCVDCWTEANVGVADSDQCPICLDPIDYCLGHGELG